MIHFSNGYCRTSLLCFISIILASNGRTCASYRQLCFVTKTFGTGTHVTTFQSDDNILKKTGIADVRLVPKNNKRVLYGTNKIWHTKKQHNLNQQRQVFSIRQQSNTYCDSESSDYSELATGIVVDTISRRNLIITSMKSSISLAVFQSCLPQTANSAQASTSNEAKNHRQLELCLVILLRVIYWAKNTIDTFTVAATTQSIEVRRKLYLDTRLCAKAMLTGKLGDGSSSKTYTVSSFQIPFCLADIEWYATDMIGLKKKNSVLSKLEYDTIINAKISLYEGIATIVEFDGLETLIDPSPRATLTLSQYNEQKFVYIQRTLSEIIVPSAIRIVTSFGSQPLQTAIQYTKTYYKNELYNGNDNDNDIVSLPTPSTTLPAVTVQPTVQQYESDNESTSLQGSIVENDYDGSY